MIRSKEFELNEYSSNSLKGSVLETELDYPKELRKLHYDHPIAPDKIEIKEKMLSNYHLKIRDFYNSPILINPDCYKTHEICDKAVNIYPSAILFVLECLKT